MSHAGRTQEPTIWQKAGMGLATGVMVGATIGTIFGTINILRVGAGPRGFLHSLSGYVLTSATTFGFFLSIGSVIRTEDYDRLERIHLSSPSNLPQLRAQMVERWAEARRGEESR